MNENHELVSMYMTTRLITFTPDVDIQSATRTLLQHKISGAPVTDKNGKLVGMLSEKDCIKLLLDGHYNQRPSGQGTVADYMSEEVTTIPADTSVYDVAYKFVKSPFRRFPVVQNGRLVGQISRRDVLKVIVKNKPTRRHIPSSWKPRVPVG